MSPSTAASKLTEVPPEVPTPSSLESGSELCDPDIIHEAEARLADLDLQLSGKSTLAPPKGDSDIEMEGAVQQPQKKPKPKKVSKKHNRLRGRR